MVLAGLLSASLSAQPAKPEVIKFDGATPVEWSQRLADSEMKRIGTGYESGGSNPRARWDYSPAVFALGLVRLGEVTRNEVYTQFGTRAVASHLNSDGTIKGYKEEDYNIDNIPPGKVLLAALDRGVKNEAYVTAVKTLRDQMSK